MNLLEFHNKLWLPSLACLARMEARGITLDVEQLNTKAAFARDICSELERELAPWAANYLRQTDSESINWNSPVQVLQFLHDFKRLPISPIAGKIDAPTRNYDKELRGPKRTTSEAALHWLEQNTSESTWISKLLKFKQTQKLGQFLEKLPTLVNPNDSRLRCSFGPKTDTGRLTSSNPNLQQIPSRHDRFEIRKAFVAAPGKLLVVADYSQLEMYVIAHFLRFELNDDSLANDLANGDVHTSTAFRVWGDQLAALGATTETIKESPETKLFRDNAKTVNYAIPYGKSASGLGYQIRDINGKSIGTKAAQDILDQYFESSPGLVELFDIWRWRANKHGVASTLLGRTRPLPDSSIDLKKYRPQSSPWWKAAGAKRAADRKAVNTVVQGSAADIVTTAMLRCDMNKQLKELGAELILQVHDELVFEIPEDNADVACAKIKDIMENPFKVPLKVQLEVDAEVGKSWGACK